MHSIYNFTKLPTIVPKTFGSWSNSGPCEGTAAKHCGPGTQVQNRTCTDGTNDKWRKVDSYREVSCATVGTALPVCGKYVNYMIGTGYKIL